MRILAIDTSTEACSVALLKNNTIYTCFELCYQEHTKHILPMVKKVLNKGNISLTNIDALAFCRGPGSFTGVRICIGISQGIALGANIPMISISTLATLAQGAERKIGETRVIAAINACMGKIYWAEYTKDKYGIWHGANTEQILKPEVISQKLKQLSGKWAIVGTAWKKIPKIIKHNELSLINANLLLPSAEDMLPIACNMFTAGKILSVEQAKPIYLKNEINFHKFIKNIN